MKKERLLNAIGQIDDRLISGADPQVHMHRKKFAVNGLRRLRHVSF